MKSLNGKELADFVKLRQLHQVRSLRARKIFPKLAIFYDNDSPVIATYMRLKKNYGEDIGAAVEIQKIKPQNAAAKISEAAADKHITGIIVQLPLADCEDDIINLIPLEKDVDGLRGESDSATAMAIHWLLNAYDVQLRDGAKLAILGYGKLVGRPLARMWRESGYDVKIFDKGDDLSQLVNYDVIVSATGCAGVLKSSMIKPGAAVVDAGTASEGGVIRGDLDEAAREREDFIVTPKIGGVGPLTVAMLFEKLLRASSTIHKN